MVTVSWAIYFWGQPPTRCSTPSACRSCCCGQGKAALTARFLHPSALRNEGIASLARAPTTPPQNDYTKRLQTFHGGRRRHGQLSFAFEVEGGQQRVRNLSAGCSRSTGHLDQAPAVLSAHSARKSASQRRWPQREGRGHRCPSLLE